MTTYLKEDGLLVGVLYMPHYVYGVLLQPIANGKVEVIRIALERFLRVCQREGGTVGSFAYQLEVGVAGKAVTRQLKFFSVNAIGVFPQSAHYRKEDG